jgi:hypothetical protein
MIQPNFSIRPNRFWWLTSNGKKSYSKKFISEMKKNFIDMITTASKMKTTINNLVHVLDKYMI